MGLDMYLRGKKYLPQDWSNPANNLTEDGFRVTSRELELGYWRKHPNLHGYIVQTFADGVDECQRIELSSDRMRQIIKAVKDGDLPYTKGFFFGKSDPEYDPPETDIAIFEKAISWLETKDAKSWRDVYYQASW